jgi:hypothetical protein
VEPLNAQQGRSSRSGLSLPSASGSRFLMVDFCWSTGLGGTGARGGRGGLPAIKSPARPTLPPVIELLSAESLVISTPRSPE